MAKFLVIARTTKPLPPNADIKGSILHWKELEKSGKAEVYAMGGLDGYVAFLDVENHADLLEILDTNPLINFGRYEVVPLTSSDEEETILRKAGIIT
ncbi:MAG: hypothetical protein ACE5KO_00670 [Candidatus Bathyarchaeia archaeon]